MCFCHDLLTCRLIFSSLAAAFICCTSMESGFLLLLKRSWLPMLRSNINLFIRLFLEKNTKLGAVLSVGLILNFLSSTLILRMSDQGKLIFGSNLLSCSYTLRPSAVTPVDRVHDYHLSSIEHPTQITLSN